MSTFDPNKLSVTFFKGVTETMPIFPRFYTLTHSDITGELFLDIGPTYQVDKINVNMRDEVLGHWYITNECISFHAYVYVSSGEFDKEVSKVRYEIFKRELPLALKAIRYGDRHLFDIYPELDKKTICIYFQSVYPEYHGVENWGEFKDYKTFFN
ncbi:staygreen family protein [Chengkuizengella axinellae]|uniref:Staygreen family protein n=1 Tax=Chengkuizengella axinellae TaxID=3064388 RepID=A0ABT9IW78_9BACL|nr:staygreen family protein [Chengkuizengella sp. 2205SS18-9]MDP5273590.1 staygreen family protein [Chengkuizengella sp. 2205SS18-9]